MSFFNAHLGGNYELRSRLGFRVEAIGQLIAAGSHDGLAIGAGHELLGGLYYGFR